MAGTGISESMMFSAAIILAVAFVGVLAGIVINAGHELEEQGTRASGAMRSDLDILNDPRTTSTSPLVVYARNTGGGELDVASLLVIVDGVVVDGVVYDVLDQSDDTLWPSGAVVQATAADANLPAGEHRVRLVGPHGVEDTLLLQV